MSRQPAVSFQGQRAESGKRILLLVISKFLSRVSAPAGGLFLEIFRTCRGKILKKIYTGIDHYAEFGDSNSSVRKKNNISCSLRAGREQTDAFDEARIAISTVLCLIYFIFYGVISYVELFFGGR